MINTGNYDTIINEFGVENLNPTLKEGHELYLDINKFYDEDQGIRETIDLYFEKLEKYISSNKSKQAEKPGKRKAGKETEPKVIAQPKKRAAPKPKASGLNIKELREKVKAKKVHHFTEDRKFVRRVIAFHNKEKTKSSILSFIKALQKAIVQKLITKKSPFVKEIREIQQRVIAFYNKMGERNVFVIPDKDLPRWVSIAGGEQVFKSIEVIKSFIGLQGKRIEEPKLKNFIKRIESSLSKGTINKDDPYLSKVKNILKLLKSLNPSKDTVQISKAELNGLEGIVGACGCSPLGKIYNTKGKTLRRCQKKTYSDAKKGACSHNKGLDGIMTAEQIANMTFDLIPFNGMWAELFGRPEKNFSLMVHGEPGAGKSTFLIKFAKYLTSLGSVLYVASEEYGSVTLKNLVTSYLNPIPANLVFVPNLDATNVSDYDFVIFDSINDAGMKLDDYKKMKVENHNTAFILVLQHTKDGKFKGGKDWEHEAQIVGKIDKGTIEIYKNRYGQKGSWHFFDI